MPAPRLEQGSWRPGKAGKKGGSSMGTVLQTGEPDSGIQEMPPIPLDVDRWSSDRGPRLRSQTSDRVSHERTLLEHLPFIERTVARVARRNALSPWDADDLEGLVKLQLIADDYAVFRKFQGKSLLTTYLTTVIQNLFRDFRIQRWGKWRPSAAARRLGEVGMQLEALLYRDGFNCDEAAKILRQRLEVRISTAEFDQIVGQLPQRSTRRFQSDLGLERLEAPEKGDQEVVESGRAEVRVRTQLALRRVLDSLQAEDRLILRMRFADGFSMRAIARALNLRERRIYARMRRLLEDVRLRIEEEGVRCEDVHDLLIEPAGELKAGLADD